MANEISEELLAKLQGAASEAELIATAAEEKIELTAEQAKELLASKQGEGELSDEDLDNVSGGFFALLSKLMN